ARSFFERQITVTDQVFVAPRRLGAFRERQPPVDGKVDLDGPVLMQLKVFHLSHFDTGDADEVSAFEARDIREDRAVGGACVKPELPEHRHQNEYEGKADNGEQRYTHSGANGPASHCSSLLIRRSGCGRW